MCKTLQEIWKADNSENKLKDLINKSNQILAGTKDEYIPEEKYEKMNSDSKYEYDPDSSPVAWKYYERMYKGIIKINPSTKIYIDSNHRIEGLFAYQKENNTTQIVQTNYGDLKLGTIVLAGDCVFNFNNDKQQKFKSITSDISSEVRNKYEICKRMHHSPYNFSIMPVTGGMQLCKGRGYDRPDFFFFSLRELYKNNRNGIPFHLAEMSTIQKIEIRNKIKEIQTPYPVINCPKNTFTSLNLYDFLMTIGSFEQYTDIFYHLANSITTSMCEFGDPNNNNLEQFEKYLDLAIDYWKKQKEYYDKL